MVIVEVEDSRPSSPSSIDTGYDSENTDPQIGIHVDREPKCEISVEEARSIIEVISSTGKFWHDWNMLKIRLSDRLKQVQSEYPESQMVSGDMSQQSSLSGQTDLETVNRLVEGYYDIFCMEVVAGNYSTWFARGNGWEYGEVDLLDLCYQESSPTNVEKVLMFSKDNTKLDVYARISHSALVPGKRYQLYMSVYLRAGAKVWQHPLQVRGVGISHLVPSGRLPTDSRNVIIQYEWANFVVAEFSATTDKKVAFNIFDRTGQYMNDFYLRGFGYYPL